MTFFCHYASMINASMIHALIVNAFMFRALPHQRSSSFGGRADEYTWTSSSGSGAGANLGLGLYLLLAGYSGSAHGKGPWHIDQQRLWCFLILSFGAPAATVFTLLHGAGNGILTIAKGTPPLAIFGAQGYGRRQGWLMASARFGQAFAPVLFALLIDRFGSGALIFSAALGLLALGALTLLQHLARPDYATAHTP